MVTSPSRSLILFVSSPVNRQASRGMLVREGHRVDSVCTAAEAVWHSHGVTFYSGIIRDITGRREELIRCPLTFILSPKGRGIPFVPLTLTLSRKGRGNWTYIWPFKAESGILRPISFPSIE